METEIKSRTVTTVETIETTNAFYELNVTRTNGEVTRVTATVTVQTTTTDEQGIAVISARSIGNIHYIDGNITVNALPANFDLPTYLSEVIEIIESIKARED